MSVKKMEINLKTISNFTLTRGDVFQITKTGDKSDLISVTKSVRGYTITGGSDDPTHITHGIDIEVVLPEGCDVYLTVNGFGRYNIDMNDKDILKINNYDADATFVIKNAYIDKLKTSHYNTILIDSCKVDTNIMNAGVGRITIENSEINGDINNSGTKNIIIDDSYCHGDINNSGTGNINLSNVSFYKKLKNSSTGVVSSYGDKKITITILNNSSTGNVILGSPVDHIKHIKNTGTGDITIKELGSFDELLSTSTGNITITDCKKPGEVERIRGNVSIPGLKKSGLSFGF